MQPFISTPVTHLLLQQWVESIAVMDFDFTHSSLESVYRYPWSSKTHIYFTISDEPLLVKSPADEDFTIYPANFILGPRLINDVVNLGSRRHVVGITFKAGGLQRLMGLPMHELINKELDASLVFGKEIRELEGRLKEAKDYKEIYVIVENFLLNKAAVVHETKPFDYAIAELVKSNGNLSIEKIASYAGLSIRQFERNCQQRLGIAPKLFARITRFSSAYLLKEKHPHLSWAGIAYEMGYFDQMHLIRDFKTFSGYTPTAIEKMLPSSIKVMTALEGGY